MRLDDSDNLYVVPVSGGKDSQLVLSLAVERYGRERVVAVHHYTGIDHSLTYEHLGWMQEHYGVPIEYTTNPKYRDMWDLIDRRNTIPSRLARFCTDELKIQAFNHWLNRRRDLHRIVVLMGMRSPESQQREARYAGIAPDDEFNLKDMNPKKVWAKFRVVRVRMPIVTMTTPAVFNMLRDRGERINPLYARGHKRVGCYPCILAGKNDYRLAARDPEGRETIVKLRDFKAFLAYGLLKGKYEPDVIIPHDLDEILETDDDLFGFYDDADDADAGCQWCAM